MALAYVNEPCRRHRSTWCKDRFCNPRSTYDRRQVEALLVALWNGDVIPQDEYPETGMPKSKSNPATQGNGMVSMIDIRRAWRAVDLKPEVRQALFWHYGQGGSIAGTTEYQAAKAVTLLQNWLNGTSNDYEENDAT